MEYSSDQAVYVTDIPYVTDDLEELKDKLEVYFGQRKHGGGEIETIICNVGGNISQAFIVFESGEVAKTAANYNTHVFLEEEEIKVSLLPEIYSYVEVELEDYYWDILTRDKAKTLISTLTSQLGQDHVFHNQKKILKLHGSYQQLAEIKECIPKAAGFGLSSEAAAETQQDVLAKSVELSDIPFVFDDKDKHKLVESLQDCIERSCGAKVESIICPVKGNMTKAIVVFQSEEDRDNYLQQESHTFDGDDMQCKILPPVYKKATITLNTFYTSIVPKLRRSKIEEQLKEKYHSEITADQIITGPFETLMEIISTWVDMADFPFEFTSGHEHQGLSSEHADETALGEESTYVPTSTDNEMDENIENIQPDSLNSWEHVTQESVINETQDGGSGGKLKVTTTQREQNPEESINADSDDKHEEGVRPVLDADNTLHNEKEDKPTTNARKSSVDDWEDLGRAESTETSGAQTHSDRDAVSNIDQSNGSNVPDDMLEIIDDGDVMNEQHDVSNENVENISAPFLKVCKNKFKTNHESLPDTEQSQQITDSVAESIESGDSNQSEIRIEIRSDYSKTEDQEEVKKEQLDQTPDNIGNLPDTTKNNQIESEKGDSLNNPTPNNGLQEKSFKRNSSSAYQDNEMKQRYPKLAVSFNSVQTSTSTESVSQTGQTKDGTTSNLRDDESGQEEESEAVAAMKTSSCRNKHDESQTSKQKTKTVNRATDEKTDEPGESGKLGKVSSEMDTTGKNDKTAQLSTGPSQEKIEKQLQTNDANADDMKTEKEPSSVLSGKEALGNSNNHSQSQTRKETDKKQMQNKDDAIEKLEDAKSSKEPSGVVPGTGTSGYKKTDSQSPAVGETDTKDDTTEKQEDDKTGKEPTPVESNEETEKKQMLNIDDSIETAKGSSSTARSKDETLELNDRNGAAAIEQIQNKNISADKPLDVISGNEPIRALTKRKTGRDIDKRADSSTSQEIDEEHMQSIEDATADKAVDGNPRNASETSCSLDEHDRKVEGATANESPGECKPNENLKTSPPTKTNNLTNASILKDKSSTQNVLVLKKNKDDLSTKDVKPVSEIDFESKSAEEKQSKETISSKQEHRLKDRDLLHMSTLDQKTGPSAAKLGPPGAGKQGELVEFYQEFKHGKSPFDGRNQPSVAPRRGFNDELRSADTMTMKKEDDIHNAAKTKLLDTNKAGQDAATVSDNYSRKIRETGEKHESNNSKASKRKLEQSGNATIYLDPDVKKIKEEEGFPKDTSIIQPPTSNTVLSSNGNELLQENTRLNSIKGKSQDSQNSSEDDSISSASASAASSEPQAAFEDNSKQDFVTIDPIAFNVLNKAAGDKLKRIKTRFKVTIAIQATNDKTSTHTAVFQPIPNASKQDLIDAKEEFINMYQDMFFKIKRMPLKCEELPQDGVIRALKQTELKVPKIVIHRKEQNEYVFCGEESVVNEAIGIFRHEAGIKPKQRKLLKKPDAGNGGFATNVPKTNNRSIDTVPSSYPSSFYTKENLVIHVLKADITRQKVDIIVNASDNKLVNAGGVAYAIVNAAGKQLQNECKDIIWQRYGHPIPVGECVVTKAYKLNCKRVIHAIGPQYQGDHSTFHRKLEDTFANVLKCAEKEGARSIAIPLISSGTYGGPKEACANALASALFNFSSLKEANHVQQVYLVNIDEQATATLQSTFAGIFQTAGNNEDMSTNLNTVPPQVDIKTSTFTTAEGIEIVVVKGDITKGSVEVIVNAANGRLAHGGGVAGAIARAAGREIRDESNWIISQRQKPLNVGECAVTDGYNLKCRKVIHAVGPVYGDCKSKKQFVDLLRLTFLTAIKHANLPIEVKEVAFPLISSGIFGGPKHLCAQAFVEAVQEFSQNERNLILQKIYMVNIDDEATQAVRHACQTCFVQPQPTGIASPQKTDPKSADQFDYRGVCAVTSNGISLHVIDGNIVEQDVDIIVNPATPTIWHSGGGISKVVFDKAGYRLEKHCKYILETVRGNKPLSVGETVVTSSYDLPCGKIIHTLSPYFDSTATSPNAFATKLEQTFLHCLKQGNAEGVQSIAFPLISSSTGPKKTCARAFGEAISAFEKSGVEMRLRNIIMVSNDKGSISAVQNTLQAYFSPTTSSDKAKGLTRHSGMKTPEYDHKNTENVASAKTSTQSAAVVDTSRGMGTLTTTVNNQQPITAITTQPTSQFKNVPSGVDIPQVTGHTGVQYSDVVKRKTVPSPNQRQTPVSNQHFHNVCGVCKLAMENIQTLDGCKHKACSGCIEKKITPNSACQECGALYGLLEEHQVGGKMKYYQMNPHPQSGAHSENGFIVIVLSVTTGTQNLNHPHPGRQFKGLSITTYLPDTWEGSEVLFLFRWAFLNGQLFKIVPASSSDGFDRVVCDRDIKFKYKFDGGFEAGGYPDSQYLPEVKRVLKKKQSEFERGNHAAEGSQV